MGNQVDQPKRLVPVHPSRVEIDVTEYDPAKVGAVSDPFGDESETPENERTKEASGRRPLSPNALLSFFLTPIEGQCWLNDVVAYPNWPSLSNNLANNIVGHHSNVVLTASSAIQLLENPLLTRNGLAVIEDDAVAQHMYKVSTHSQQLFVNMEEQAQTVVQHTQVELEGGLCNEVDCEAHGEESSQSELSFKCTSTSSRSDSNVTSANKTGLHAHTRPVEDSASLASSCQTDGSIKSTYLCGSDSTTRESRQKVTELTFARIPIRKPDLRSYLPSAHAVMEYDRLQTAA